MQLGWSGDEQRDRIPISKGIGEPVERHSKHIKRHVQKSFLFRHPSRRSSAFTIYPALLLAAPVSNVLRIRLHHSTRARYVSSILHTCISLHAHVEAWPALLPRYSALNPRCDTQGGDGILSQYYSVATGTVLMYDHLLTLADEVRQRVIL